MPDSRTPSVAAAASLRQHYQRFDQSDIQQGFKSLDDAAGLGPLMRRVQASDTRNFIVDFGEDEAWAAFDLSPSSIMALAETERPNAQSARWINIWLPFQNRQLLQLLAKRYDFSPRLLALMCSDPTQPMSENTITAQSQHHWRSRVWSRHSKASSSDTKIEEGSDELSDLSSISSHDSLLRGNLYRIADEMWHYSSVDFGRSYICLGFNSLYGTKNSGSTAGSGMLPHCTRLWTWLILCEDSTVITINEDPFPYVEGKLDALQRRIIVETRRNLVNVFRSLSSVDDDPLLATNPMSLLPIRSRVGTTPEETAHRVSDAPGLLFYYLFENWHNSYTLVARKESRYGVELKSLRTEMFSSPKLAHIDRLDTIGQELGVLRRHYQSYDRIIDRLLEPRAVTTASLENSQVISEASQVSLDTIRPLVTEKQSMLGVSLSSAARVRFKRLKDLIVLYALSEVEEYVKQKESLVAMNFNLIAIKESLDVERLTRITLLLTKMSMLFLPISLMTAYFSMQLVNVEYTVTTYWISFAVVVALSLLGLFVFGVISGSMQTVVFSAIWKGMLDAWKWMVARMRR